MKVKQHNIEVFRSEGYAIIDWSKKVFEVQLDDIDFEDYIQKQVEESYTVCNHSEGYERAFDSISDYLETYSASSVVQDILIKYNEEQFTQIANEITE